MDLFARLLHLGTRGAGPHVARALHLSVALVGLVAWMSWWVQIEVLVGPSGLVPAAPWVERAHAAGASLLDLPTLLRFTGAGAAMLHALCALGVGACLCALAGLATRGALGLSAALYLSLVSVCGPFAAFQWDNLMVETFALTALLPREGGRLTHLALRFLLFRLYFGSGMAKLQSPLGDWLDGSAMTFYYETTPLPTPLSWWAHQLPTAWHHLESWTTLALELVVPFGAFAGRRVRHATAAALTAFQVVNLLTGNFGFFVYLSLALHLALVDDGTLCRGLRKLPEARVPWPALPRWPRLRDVVVAALLLAAVFEQGVAIAGAPAGSFWLSLRTTYLPLRLVNTYALFASVTQSRIEPLVEIDAGEGFVAYPLHYKPGPADRPLGWVAPHQPRVDFRLWFYGLRSDSRPPGYVQRLAALCCTQPASVQPLFVDPLPRAPRAVRIRFERYRFTDIATWADTGAHWQVEDSWPGPGMSCAAGVHTRP